MVRYEKRDMKIEKITPIKRDKKTEREEQTDRPTDRQMNRWTVT